MRKIWWLVGLVALGLACGAASAQNSAIQGYCQNGGVKVSVSGLLSTNTVQASYPQCQVNVYLTGTTTRATIYTNAGGSPLSNPFTANTNGLWLFFAANGTGYDVTINGGVPIPMPFPVTLTDIVIGGGSSGGVISINGTPGAYTFTGSGVSCVGTTCTFTSGGGGFTAGGDLSGSSSSQTVIGLKSVPFCTGFTPTNGQAIEYTTGSSPNPCYTAATPGGGGTPGGSNHAVQFNSSSAFGGTAFTGIVKASTTADPSAAVAADVDALGALTNNTSGNSGTATALAATPTLCAGGNVPLGVLASGNATGCAPVAYANVTGTPGSIILSPAPNVNIPFTEGAGTVAHDSSGNHNDCTFAGGSNAPLWVPGGINHLTSSVTNGWCSLPASVTRTDATSANSRTIEWCGYIRPQTQGNLFATYDVLIGSSNQSGAGTLWASGNQLPRLQGYLGNYTIGGGLANGTITNQPTIGYHCVTLTKGSTTDSTVDHLYIDATEVTYLHQVASWDLRVAGDSDQVGQAAWNGAIAFGTNNTNYVLMYDAVLTPAQVAQNSVALNFLAFQSRGVGLAPVQSFTQSPNLVCNGDSQMNGTPGGVTPPCNSAGFPGLLNLTYLITNIAATGTTIKTHVAEIPVNDVPVYSSFAQFNFDIEDGGINDITVAGGTGASVYADRVSWATGVHKAGYQPMWMTLISNASDTIVQAANTLMRANANAQGVILIDIAEEPCLGKTGAYLNPSPCADFQGDGLHWSQTGADAGRNIIANVVNWATGSTIGNPTFITASTHTIAAGEGYTSVTPATSTALTLPSCIGYSTTTPFYVYNASASSTVTVVPSGSQTLNGSGSALTIPNIATGTFVVYPLASSTAGCFWIATVAPGSGGGSGTVTSVAQTVPTSLLSITGSPVTTSGTLALGLTNAAQNSVWAGPVSGGAGAPSYQTAPTISAANMTSFPTFNQNTTGTAANLSGTPALPNGTTATTQTVGDNTTKLATDAFVLANPGTPTFSAITSSTNTTATMICGTGCSLSRSGTGAIDASLLLGGTWAIPGAIGTTSPAAGTFTNQKATATVSGIVATIASASTITPVTPVIILTGSATVHTITAPSTGCTTTGTDCTLTIITDASGPPDFANDVNIAAGYTLSLNSTYTLTYDPTNTKWYPPAAPTAGQVWPAAPGITVCTGTPCTAWGTSILPASGVATFLATPTSANLAAALTDETGTGAAVFANTPTLVTPVIGAATGTSLLVTGNLDGTAPVTITTGTTATLGGTFKSGYTFNNEATTAAAVTYTLPTAAAGLQYCIANLPVTTGVLQFNTSASGQFIGRAGAYGSTGGHATSGGALGDAACVVGVDSTHWLLYTQSGTWTNP